MKVNRSVTSVFTGFLPCSIYSQIQKHSESDQALIFLAGETSTQRTEKGYPESRLLEVTERWLLPGFHM